YRHLISTMPLPVLIRLMGNEVPLAVRHAAAGLRHVSVRCVNIGVGRANITDKHWIYYPEDTVFHRIFAQGNVSPHNNPPGGFGFTCEITYSEYKPLPCDSEALIQRCLQDCRKVGFINAEDPILVANQVDMPYAYVVYDHARRSNVATIRAWLEDQDILLAGRYSEWEYYNSDHAFIAGKKVAETVRELQQEYIAQASAHKGRGKMQGEAR
ncbi:MAG TPA: amine oxidase, partial [Gammaproteobacteria bacterium]|nr:amine oxidase [Gammaproteobacteria bacterium]